MEWRRRNRNTYSRLQCRRSQHPGGGRRYTDRQPIVDKVFDAVVAYYEERLRVLSGGSSEARLERRREILYTAIALLEGK